MLKPTLAALFLSLPCAAAFAQPVVATTEPLTPEKEIATFHLPPGFEIQLVATEPDVHKPMNLRFDAAGRLLVTHSLEYPFAAKPGVEPRDAVTAFEEFGPDGRARKVTKIVDKLNIPIGLVPVKDGLIAFSIPSIYKFTEPNAEGVYQKREVLYTGFGQTDTHGLNNSFTRGLDGWVYATHGFSNASETKGADGVVMKVHSGNVYRFRPDGSHIEVYSRGQVNPFGMCIDPLGNIYTADCHSRPITMVLHEAYYQSFGKPHDGLGYAPDMIDHERPGTGLGGVAYYAATQFPEEYRDCLYTGNVIVGRIHRDKLKWDGSSPHAVTQDDFLTCDDPWFRPVSVELGPDGALYILDFYNRIIGHYEVPLTHPQRDRERGRIWRIVYTGTGKKSEPAPLPDLTKLSAEDLAKQIGNPNLALRIAATHLLGDKFPKEAAALAKAALADPASKVDGLWVLERTHSLDNATASQLAEDSDRAVRVHVVKALGSRDRWEAFEAALVRTKLSDGDPFVRRAAVEALAMHPHPANVQPLLKLWATTAGEDVQLVHATRISLRDQLQVGPVAKELNAMKLDEADQKRLLNILSAVPSDAAATFIFDYARAHDVDQALLIKVLPQVARYGSPEQVEALPEFAQDHFKGDVSLQLSLLQAIRTGVAERGMKPGEKLSKWADALVASILKPSEDAAGVWENFPVPGMPPSANPWVQQDRPYTDGKTGIPLISSLGPAGEFATGILRSSRFTIPGKLSFFIAGHNGSGNNHPKNNYIRILKADGTEITRTFPPGNDTAFQTVWDLSDAAGQQGYVEIVDGTAESGFAWLAVSRFDPPVIRVPTGVGSAKTDALRLAAEFKLTDRLADIEALAATPGDTLLRLTACDVLSSLDRKRAVPPLAILLADPQQPLPMRSRSAEMLGRIDSDDARMALMTHLKDAPTPVAISIGAALASTKPGAALLLDQVGKGKASAALLREPTVASNLKTSSVPDLDAQIAKLTAGLSPADDRIAKLIEQRRLGYIKANPDPAAGKLVFARSVCMACHRIGDTGGQIGPALDGIGARGLERLLEDVLDPNRNVDTAFRVTLLKTKDGQTLAGFGLHEEGATLVMSDSAAKPIRVAAADVTERIQSPLSPMPANISEIMPEADFYPLLSYLLSLKAGPK
jgi:putative membrane-bound dehydrogenase-like protein